MTPPCSQLHLDDTPRLAGKPAGLPPSPCQTEHNRLGGAAAPPYRGEFFGHGKAHPAMATGGNLDFASEFHKFCFH
jgi:hypothetical protein